MRGDELESRILLENDGLLAVDKPPNLPSTGRSLDDRDCLQWLLSERAGGLVWAVHQLDADTSGVNLFTTQRELVEPLKRAMTGPDAAKRYIAWVHGDPTWAAISSTAPIGPVDETSLGVSSNGKAARSTFEVTRRGSSWARVEATIATGRTHQIRIHLAHLGHPLVGEEWYRDPACALHPRQALHARKLTLAAPFDLTIHAAIPEDLARLEQRLEDGLSARLGDHKDVEAE